MGHQQHPPRKLRKPHKATPAKEEATIPVTEMRPTPGLCCSYQYVQTRDPRMYGKHRTKSKTPSMREGADRCRNWDPGTYAKHQTKKQKFLVCQQCASPILFSA